ncbi:Uncharacterised protein [uncultured archaeon]|nr:Uncharacterised protein [uncultured archaeon]
MDRVIIERNGAERQVNTKVVGDVSKLKPLLNKECWRVFESLHRKPAYPAQLAKELSMNEQKVYYHVKQLRAAGLLEVEKSEERNGALAKYYSAQFDSFALVPNLESAGKGNRIIGNQTGNGRTQDKAATPFLEDFCRKGIFSAKIVVGSPDPHGPHKGRARDGHLAGELTAFFGANCSGFELPLVFLDTMVKDLKEENSNLVIVGGPVANKLCEQVNRFLPVQFSSSGGNWAFVSGPSGKSYAEDSAGVVEKIPHPFFRNKWILVVAGKRNSGTIAAILALVKRTAETIKPNSYDKKALARVVEGLDANGDGLIDDVEFRE